MGRGAEDDLACHSPRQTPAQGAMRRALRAWGEGEREGEGRGTGGGGEACTGAGECQRKACGECEGRVRVEA